MIVVMTNSAQETKELAKKLAPVLCGGDVISLTGDLGAGKTCFTQGLAQGLGIKEVVTSPTFNLIKEYPGRLNFYHFDVYRLQSELELIYLGYEEYFFGEGVTVIEWGDKIVSLLPAEFLEIAFRRLLQDNVRRLEIKPYGSRWAELVKKWLQNYL